MAEGKENFGTYHINSDMSNYEVARSNYFTFIVNFDIPGTTVNNLVKSDFDHQTEATSSDKITNGQEVIKLSVVSSSVPHFTISPISMRRGNSVMKYAGNPEFPEGTLKVQDFVGLNAKSVLMAWQALAYDEVNDLGGRAINYKKNCSLYEYTQDYTEIRHWDLIGCWVSAVSEDEFSMDADGARQLTATIQYDRAVMHMPATSK